MSKVDLHVHSQYSRQPAEWVLRKLGMRECYVDIDHIYHESKARGMDYVTITDHNEIKGSNLLLSKYPKEAFTGSEITVVFPENGCKVHILVFDIIQPQFDHLKELRWDIYRLRDYLRQEKIPYSVAHATSNVNGVLTTDIVEKLILLFDVFEGINGARSQHFNYNWTRILNYLDPYDIERLHKKYYIEPFSENPWIKGFTGGTDDHTGLFIGRTFTKDDGSTKQDFIQNLKNKNIMASGRSSDFKTRVFGFYKIQHDWKKNIEGKKKAAKKRMAGDIIFDHVNAKFDLKQWVFLQCAKHSQDPKKYLFARYVENLRNDLKGIEPNNIDKRIEVAYKNSIASLDAYLVTLIDKYTKDFNLQFGLNISCVIDDISVILDKVLPLYATYKFIHQNNEINHELTQRFRKGNGVEKKKRILWFTDTLTDLNGVSLIVKEFMRQSKVYDLDIKVVCCLNEEDFAATKISGINLEPITSYVPDLYKSYVMRIPSFINSVEKVQAYKPDEIIISTPGPVGLTGLLAGKLSGIKVFGVYHTDFTKQMERIVGQGIIPGLIEKYLKWFYARVDRMKIPTSFYKDALQKRGYVNKNIQIFKRGIDASEFKYTMLSKLLLCHDDLFKNSFTLLYTGRISKDKNLKFLSIVYKKLLVNCPRLNLLLVGDGPRKEYIQNYFKGCHRVVFVDKVDRHELPFFYSLADLFVFPSTTDTFGMVVLEAQSCSLPVCVMDSCGSRDLVEDGKTGFVLPEDVKSWVTTIAHVMDVKQNDKERYMRMKNAARMRIINQFHWSKAFEALIHGEKFNLSLRENKDEKILS